MIGIIECKYSTPGKMCETNRYNTLLRVVDKQTVKIQP